MLIKNVAYFKTQCIYVFCHLISVYFFMTYTTLKQHISLSENNFQHTDILRFHISEHILQKNGKQKNDILQIIIYHIIDKKHPK